MHTTTKQQIKNAINAVVSYNTLPSQIDYVTPYKRKAEVALTLIEDSPERIKKYMINKIEQETNAYYEENESGYSTAELDNMF